MSGLVCVDACVAAKWVLPEENSDLADALYVRCRDEGDTLLAPLHFPSEVVNAIRKRVARKEITPAEGDDLVATFLAFPVLLAAPEGLYDAALSLAHRFDRPTVYDTLYVALAETAGCQFWTADKRLINALNGRLPFVKSLESFRVSV